MIFNTSAARNIIFVKVITFPFVLVWSSIIQLLLCDFPFVVIMLNLNVFWFLHFLLYDFHLEEIILRSFHAAVGTDSPQGYHSLSILAFTNRKIFSMSHYGQNVSQVITLSPFKWDRPMKENFIMVVSNAHHFDVYFKGNFDCITFLGTLSNILFWYNYVSL